MTTAEALLHGVYENLDDDAPRLVYSDWLEDHGDTARAEFIRLHCELFRLHEDDPRRIELAFRAGEIESKHLAEWLGPLPELIDYHILLRGFIGLNCTAKQLLSQRLARAAVGGALAHVQSLDLDFEEERLSAARLRRLFAAPVLEQFAHLTLATGDMSSREVEYLAASPRLTRLHTLDLGGSEIDHRGARALAHSPNLPGLRALDLGGNPLGDAGAMALGRSPLLGQLQCLYLWETEIGPEGVVALVQDAGVGRLKELDLSNCSIDAPAATALAGSAWLSTCARLDLHGCRLNDHALARLAASKHLGRVEVLDLAGTLLTEDGLSRLAGSGNLPRLRELELWRVVSLAADDVRALAAGLGGQLCSLDLRVASLSQGAYLELPQGNWPALQDLNLSNCNVGDAEAALLARWKGPPLRRLALSSNRIGPAGLEALTGSPLVRGTAWLILNHNPLREGLEILARPGVLASARLLRLRQVKAGPEGAAALARCSDLAGLIDLDLNDNRIGDAGAEALAASPYLKGLHRLSLRECRIQGRGGLALARSPHLDGLLSLGLYGNKLGKRAEAALRERFGDRVSL
jgi:uncharacterized protein (TIGR02996 family)